MLLGIDGFLRERIKDEEFGHGRITAGRVEALASFMEAFDDLDAHGRVVGFALEDLIRAITVDRTLHGSSDILRHRRSRSGEGWLGLCVAANFRLELTLL